eukprot:TRINITY_DN3492_c3_g5_i1.p1 TRINITY_DN3492_c3_g5~~TRINITY_DN3492_c3_g5_i1.p1  ORF type:complete len:945 (+),score=260.32 TRINITY_DN3492_c3_g5_i1:44-2878(+)
MAMAARARQPRQPRQPRPPGVSRRPPAEPHPPPRLHRHVRSPRADTDVPPPRPRTAGYRRHDAGTASATVEGCRDTSTACTGDHGSVGAASAPAWHWSQPSPPGQPRVGPWQTPEAARDGRTGGSEQWASPAPQRRPQSTLMSKREKRTRALMDSYSRVTVSPFVAPMLLSAKMRRRLRLSWPVYADDDAPEGRTTCLIPITLPTDAVKAAASEPPAADDVAGADLAAAQRQAEERRALAAASAQQSVLMCAEHSQRTCYTEAEAVVRGRLRSAMGQRTADSRLREQLSRACATLGDRVLRAHCFRMWRVATDILRPAQDAALATLQRVGRARIARWQLACTRAGIAATRIAALQRGAAGRKRASLKQAASLDELGRPVLGCLLASTTRAATPALQLTASVTAELVRREQAAGRQRRAEVEAEEGAGRRRVEAECFSGRMAQVAAVAYRGVLSVLESQSAARLTIERRRAADAAAVEQLLRRAAVVAAAAAGGCVAGASAAAEASDAAARRSAVVAAALSGAVSAVLLQRRAVVAVACPTAAVSAAAAVTVQLQAAESRARAVTAAVAGCVAVSAAAATAEAVAAAAAPAAHAAAVCVAAAAGEAAFLRSATGAGCTAAAAAVTASAAAAVDEQRRRATAAAVCVGAAVATRALEARLRVETVEAQPAAAPDAAAESAAPDPAAEAAALAAAAESDAQPSPAGPRPLVAQDVAARDCAARTPMPSSPLTPTAPVDRCPAAVAAALSACGCGIALRLNHRANLRSHSAQSVCSNKSRKKVLGSRCSARRHSRRPRLPMSRIRTGTVRAREAIQDIVGRACPAAVCGSADSSPRELTTPSDTALQTPPLLPALLALMRANQKDRLNSPASEGPLTPFGNASPSLSEIRERRISLGSHHSSIGFSAGRPDSDESGSRTGTSPAHASLPGSPPMFARKEPVKFAPPSF